MDVLGCLRRALLIRACLGITGAFQLFGPGDRPFPRRKNGWHHHAISYQSETFNQTTTPTDSNQVTEEPERWDFQSSAQSLGEEQIQNSSAPRCLERVSGQSICRFECQNSTFSAQTETSLAVIVQETGQSRQSLTTIDTRLSEIQQSLMTAQKAIDAQSHSLGHILTSISSSVTTGHFRRNGHQAAYPFRGGYFESAQNVPRYTKPPSPAGIFELSGNFFPELYTISEGPSSVPMHVYSAFEEHSSTLCRTNCYQFFFMKLPRQWRRLSLSLTICKASRFWDYTKLSTPKQEFVRSSHCLPTCFQSRIEELIWSIGDLHHDTHLSLVVLEESAEESDSQEVLPHSRFTISPSKVGTGYTEKDTALLLYHLGCQRYYENEVVQIAIMTPTAFAVCVGKQILSEVKISVMPEDLSLYTIQLLHCLRSSPGLARFAGVVFDSSGQHVKSYLREIPLKGWMFSIITDALDRGSSVAWDRRERWARERVERL
ncbi:hypothetical protein BKA61DRAFT_17462 [Leptodontidium sp. MPI-SDFR-AT-0119]|nr:hypothetical protein BKA61DRAFT_17462 [Leptodontidium sp. MPI-SDFR-AT-0119]